MTVEIRPQPGPQTTFLSSAADIAIYGGSAGGGKTWALLLECLRHIANPQFGAVIFRRTQPQILNQGGLWDEAAKLYPDAGGSPRLDPLAYSFPSGARVQFAAMQYEKNRQDWQGSQIPLLVFDELTHFSEEQFFYMLSRNRSMCGIRPYVRGSCNPDPLSWVKDFLAPWINKKFPNPAESGELRYFVRDGGIIRWVEEGTPDAKSLTFVRSSVYDNKILLATNPEYLSNLKALPLVDRLQLLDGDWDVVAEGNMFKRIWFGEPLVVAPMGLRYCRYWDLAATKPKPGKDPDWTVGLLLGADMRGYYYVIDVIRLRDTPGSIETLVAQTAAADRARFGRVAVRMEQEPGSAGVSVIDGYRRRVLPGYDFDGARVTGPKTERAKIASGHAEAGNIRLVAGHWNTDFLNELCVFPNPKAHDDQVDTLSGALGELTLPEVEEPCSESFETASAVASYQPR